MIEIKGVIFDFGGVISHPQDQGYVDQIMNAITSRPTGNTFCGSTWSCRPAYDGGQMGAEEYWVALTDRLGLRSGCLWQSPDRARYPQLDRHQSRTPYAFAARPAETTASSPRCSPI